MSRYRFIAAEKATYPVSLLCRVLDLSRASFYAWLERGPSVREQTDQHLLAQIRRIHRRRRRGLTRPDPAATPAPDLVGRLFDPAAPDRTWFADISYIPTEQGWLYLAAVLDGCSRKVVGWAMADHLRAELALDALQMALQRRLRELLRDPEDRAGPHPHLADPPGRPHRHLRIHRDLLQPPAPPLGPGLAQPCRV